MIQPWGAPASIPLVDPPLDLVVAQVRFQPNFGIEQAIGGVQKALQADYPVPAKLNQFAIDLPPQPGSVPAVNAVDMWRFATRDNEWQVTVAADFLALETTRYGGHRSLVDRLRQVLEAYQAHAGSPDVLRVGVRYVQRLTEPTDLARLADYFRPEVSALISCVPDSVTGTVLSTGDFTFGDGDGLVARWGLLASGVTPDTAIAPADGPCWVMDLDAYSVAPAQFAPASVANKVMTLSRQQYAFFRWATTVSFMTRFGGEVTE